MSAKPALSVRAPKSVDEFVSGGPAPAAAESHGVELQVAPANHPPPASVSEGAAESHVRPKMRGVVKRANGSERARVTVYLELAAAAKLRRHCFENGLDLSDIAAKAIERFVARL